MGNFCTGRDGDFPRLRHRMDRHFHIPVGVHLPLSMVMGVRGNPNHPQPPPSAGTPTPRQSLSAASTSPPPNPIRVPPLFDLCVAHLCSQLIDEAALRHIKSRRNGRSFPLSHVDYFYYNHSKEEGGGTLSLAQRGRTLSISSKHSPELVPRGSALNGSQTNSSSGSPIVAHSLPPPMVTNSLADVTLSYPIPIVPTRGHSSRSLITSSSSSSSSHSSPTADNASQHTILASLNPVGTPKRGGTSSVSTNSSHSSPFHTHSSSQESMTVPLLSLPDSSTSTSTSFPPLYSPSSSSSMLSPTDFIRELHLPESMIQIVFDKLVSERLLTLSNCSLFVRARLQSIRLRSYPGLTDQWLNILFQDINDAIKMHAAARERSILLDTPPKQFTAPFSGGTIEMEVKEQRTSAFRTPTNGSLNGHSHSRGHSGGDAMSPLSCSPSTSSSNGYSTPPRASRATTVNSPLSASSYSPSLHSSTSPQSPTSLSTPAHQLIDRVYASSPYSALDLGSWLQHFDVSRCDQISDRCLAALSVCQNLITVNLQGCTQITDDLMRSVMPNKRKLIYLNMGGCKGISDFTLEAIVSNHLFQLKFLLIDGTSITDNGLRLLSPLTELRELSCGYNGSRVTASGLQWLSQCPHMKRVSINSTSVHNIAFLKGLKKLRFLHIGNLKEPFDFREVSTPLNRLMYLDLSRSHMFEIPTPLLSPNLLFVDLSFSPIRTAKLTSILESLSKRRESHVTDKRNKRSDMKRILEREMKSFESSSESMSEDSDMDILNDGMSTPSVVKEAAEERDKDRKEGGDKFPEKDPSMGRSVSTPEWKDVRDPRLPSTSPYRTFVTPNPPTYSPTASPNLPPLTRHHSQPQSQHQSNSHSGSPISSATSSPRGETACVPSCSSASGCGLSSCRRCSLLHPLRVLRLESCGVDNFVCKAISSFTNLRELNVSDTDISNEGFAFFAPLSHLVSLNVNGCKLTNGALNILANFKQLKKLYLDCPSISDGGLAHLAENKRIEVLDLFEAHITDAGIDYLGALPNLHVVELCGGRITNVGVAKLSGLSSLVSINLSQNSHIDDDGLMALSSLPMLIHVNLSGTGATHRGLEFIHSLPHIRQVSLFGCKIKPTAAKIKELPRGIQLGVDEGVVAIE